jgi:hypothetical protein
MNQTNHLLDTEVDIYLTETPYGPVRAIFSSDMDQPGVIFDGAGWPAADYMREVIAKTVGPGGHSYTERSITADIYQDFCQVEGVVIHSPILDLKEPQGDPDMPVLDSVAYAPKPNVDMVALRSELMDHGQSITTRIGIAQTLMDARMRTEKDPDHVEFGLKKSGKVTRERINKQVVELVEAISNGSKDPADLTKEERELFVQYSGKGGPDGQQPI